jgi:hypothetical protein
MSNFRDVKNGQPKYLQEVQLQPIIEVETPKTPPRYLWELANNPNANLWDYYRNTGSSRMRLFTKLWWQNT